MQSWQKSVDSYVLPSAIRQAEKLQKRIDDLADPDLGPKDAMEDLLENQIESLRTFAPNHPLIETEKICIQLSKSGKLPMRESKLPKLREIGCTNSACPYCGIQLDQFPSRGAKCKSCGRKYFVATRPLDSKKVILTESESQELQVEWEKDYVIKQATRWKQRT